ncbi:MAG: undecaprenyl-diphosphate phosphatase, partial [Chloroflexota bacterium]
MSFLSQVESEHRFVTLFHTFLLGIVQGLTEFIPVSSTAHILIASNLLKIPSDEKT